MKVCCRCSRELPVSSFLGTRGKEYSFCIECKKQYDREYWQKTKDKRNERKSSNAKKIRDRNADYVFDILRRSSCSDCPEDDFLVLEFDHRDPSDKYENISVMIGHCSSIESIQKEIDKCDIVCSNCHRRRTAKQFGYRRILSMIES